MNQTPRKIALSRRQVLISAAATGGAALLAAPNLAFGATDKIVCQIDWIKSVQFGGCFVGIEKSFFAEQGLDVEFLSGGPTIDPVNVIAAGQALLGDRDSTSLILARGKGIPVKAFAAPLQLSPFALITLKGKKISTLKELEGKAISLSQGRRAAMNALLRRAKVDVAEITFVPGGTDPAILATGQVDGYFGWYTQQGTMLTSRGVEIEYTTLHDLGDPAYPESLFALEETFERQKDLLVRFVRAQVKSWQWYADNPDAVARMVVDKYGVKGLDLAQQTTEARLTAPLITTGAAAKNGALWIDTPFFEHGIGLSAEAGLIQGAMRVEDVMTQDIVKAARG